MKFNYNMALLGMALVFSLSHASKAAVVFSDDFNYPDGTILNGQTPDVGGNWNVTAGGGNLTINGGDLDTTGDGRVAFSTFTAPLSTGQILTLTYDTLTPGGANFFSGGYAGVSLYSGGAEQFFTGDGGGGTTWAVAAQAAGGDQYSADSTSATSATFKYIYNTGAWTLTTLSGVNLSGTGTAQLPLNQLRVANGNNGDIALDNLVVDISAVPEPSSAAMLGLLGAAMILRRRK